MGANENRGSDESYLDQLLQQMTSAAEPQSRRRRSRNTEKTEEHKQTGKMSEVLAESKKLSRTAPSELVNIETKSDDIKNEDFDLDTMLEEKNDVLVQKNDTPAQKNDIPAQGKDTLAQENDIPVQGKDTLAQENDTPAQGKDTLAQKDIFSDSTGKPSQMEFDFSSPEQFIMSSGMSGVAKDYSFDEDVKPVTEDEKDVSISAESIETESMVETASEEAELDISDFEVLSETEAEQADSDMVESEEFVDSVELEDVAVTNDLEEALSREAVLDYEESEKSEETKEALSEGAVLGYENSGQPGEIEEAMTEEAGHENEELEKSKETVAMETGSEYEQPEKNEEFLQVQDDEDTVVEVDLPLGSSESLQEAGENEETKQVDEAASYEAAEQTDEAVLFDEEEYTDEETPYEEDVYEEDEYGEYDEYEWEEADDMNRKTLPDPSELDFFEEGEQEEDFLFEDSLVMDEIEKELLGAIPPKKERKRSRRKSAEPVLGTEAEDLDYSQMDLFGAQDQEASENLSIGDSDGGMDFSLSENGQMDELFSGEGDGISSEAMMAEDLFSSDMAGLGLDDMLSSKETDEPSLDTMMSDGLSDMNLFGEEGSSDDFGMNDSSNEEADGFSLDDMLSDEAGTSELGEEENSKDADGLSDGMGDLMSGFSMDDLFDGDASGNDDTLEMAQEGNEDNMDENNEFNMDALFGDSDGGSDGGSDDIFGMMGNDDMSVFDSGDGSEANSDDIFSFGDDFGGVDNIFAMDETAESGESSSNSDPDNIFAESLTGVGFDEIEEQASEESSEGEEEDDKKSKKAKKKNKKKKAEGKGFFARLFGNIIDKKSAEQFEQMLREQEQADFKKSEKKRIKEGNLTEEEKAKKEALEAELAAAKEEKAAAKEAKKKEAEEKKAEKAAAKKAKKEALEAEAAKEVDEGRINRVGASVVFVFFGAIAAGVVIGTNIYSYSQSITKATEYFDVQKYNNAYEEVYGLTIKEKDETIYEKIMTVMYVNKELNSYNNFYALRMYPEALDSLIKGLKRYEKYKQDAQSLGIESDLNYVRRQILGELKGSFSISEKQAMKLAGIEEQNEYSEAIQNKTEALGMIP